MLNAALDEVTQKKLETSFARMLNDDILVDKVVFVMNKVTYMNNIGLNILIKWQEILKKKNKRLVLALLSSAVRNYLKSLGYMDYFHVAANLPEAKDMLEKGWK